MSTPADLETLRAIFADGRTHCAVAKVVKLGLASDRSVLRAQCRILTQDRDVVARVCWDACGPDSGIVQFPEPGDLVLVQFAEGDPNQAYLTKRLSNRTDKFPSQATLGHLFVGSLSGKKLYLCSDTQVLIGLGASSDPDEPLVLGNVLTELLVDAFTQIELLSSKVAELSAEVSTLAGAVASHTHAYENYPGGSGPNGATTASPDNASAFSEVASAADGIESDAEEIETELAGLRADPVENGDILSDLAFTEKGGES